MPSLPDELTRYPNQTILLPRETVFNYLDELPVGSIIQLDQAFAKIRLPDVSEKSTKKLISVVIPIYFEENLIDELVRRLVGAMKDIEVTGYRYELVFVNDGSTDLSLEKLLAHQKIHPEIEVLNFSRNFGHQAAITAGMNYAKGDAVVVIDGDLQDPPEVIKELVKKWEEGFHVAYGQRIRREGETPFKLITAKIFYRMMSRLSDVEIPVDAGDFRLLDRKVIDQLKNLPERSRYIRGLVNWVGFRHTPVQYRRDARYAGETKYTLRKMLRFAFDGLTSFSDKPLHIAGYLGTLFALCSFLGILWIFIGFFLNPQNLVTGWASLMTVVFFLGATQLLALSIMGLYIGRIYKEAQARPHYIVEKIFTSHQDEGWLSH